MFFPNSPKGAKMHRLTPFDVMRALFDAMKSPFCIIQAGDWWFVSDSEQYKTHEWYFQDYGKRKCKSEAKRCHLTMASDNHHQLYLFSFLQQRRKGSSRYSLIHSEYVLHRMPNFGRRSCVEFTRELLYDYKTILFARIKPL